jgi:hypothetical protein
MSPVIVLGSHAEQGILAHPVILVIGVLHVGMNAQAFRLTRSQSLVTVLSTMVVAGHQQKPECYDDQGVAHHLAPAAWAADPGNPANAAISVRRMEISLPGSRGNRAGEARQPLQARTPGEGALEVGT